MGQMAHLSNYSVLKDECEVVALAEPRKELAKLVAARYGVSEIYENHLQLLDKAKVDAIVAPQQFRYHPAIIPDILRAGIPVFTEKPLCLTVDAGRELVRIGKQYGTLHMVGYHKRSDPACEYAKKVVDSWKESGDYGSLRYIRVTMPPGDWINGADRPLNTREPYPVIDQEPGPAGYTEEQTHQLAGFVNYYIHQVNLIRFFLGESYRLAFGDRQGLLLVGESESGVTVTLEMAPYRTSREWHESVLVAFEHGFVSVELPPPLARQRAGLVSVLQDNPKIGEPQWIRPSLPNLSAMRKQAMNFLAAVRGERPAPCTSEEALEDLILAQNYIDAMIKANAIQNLKF
jgi:predicted dehydrogenase